MIYFALSPKPLVCDIYSVNLAATHDVEVHWLLCGVPERILCIYPRLF